MRHSEMEARAKISCRRFARKFFFVTRANDLGFIIDEVLDSLPNRKIENENNARIVAEISKWNVCIQNWIDLYN